MNERPIALRIDGDELSGDLALPDIPRGLVIFAHGSGSSRHSPRNRAVARTLRDAGFATLLLDLLTPREDEYDARTAALRFDIELLARRLASATDWARGDATTRDLPVGYFGASTGAAAAIVAASERGDVAAIVSRGGRPDLAADRLAAVVAPTLLIVGGDDVEVLELNRAALRRIAAAKDLAVVPGATHLFQEPGALDEVARLATAWFRTYLASATPRRAGRPV